jgi:hypothetical protein
VKVHASEKEGWQEEALKARGQQPVETEMKQSDTWKGGES